MDFPVPADHRTKLKESEKKDKGNRKIVEHESYGDASWCSWYSHQNTDKGTGVLGNKGTSGDYPNYVIIKIGQNTKTSPGDLRRFAVIKTHVKKRQWTVVWKSPKRVE